MDPREAVIRDRFADVGRVLLFASSKGGVGKTCISCASALALREMGYRVGLLDLDITNPTAHLVLGVNPKDVEIEEEKGVKPVLIKGIEFMSPAIFTRGEPSPLRGTEIHDAILEILSVTKWSRVDYLVIDAPPGMSDEILDALRYIPTPEFIVIATPSPLSIDSTRRFVKFLADEKVRILGLIENMGRGSLEGLCKELGIDYLGFIPMDPELDKALARGSIEFTKFYIHVRSLCERIVDSS